MTREELIAKYATDMLDAVLEHDRQCPTPCDAWTCESKVAAQYRVARKRYARISGDPLFA